LTLKKETESDPRLHDRK
jgi:hypothetical protein